MLKDWVEAPDLEGYRSADPRQIVAAALTADIERYALPDHVREDYLSSYEGDRFVESMRYVRSYPTELPVLRDLLPQIQTPVQIIAGARDPAVPPVNAEFLHERLPRSKLDIIDAGHFTWEDGADEYAALVTSWWSGGYANIGSRHPPELEPKKKEPRGGGGPNRDLREEKGGAPPHKEQNPPPTRGGKKKKRGKKGEVESGAGAHKGGGGEGHKGNPGGGGGPGKTPKGGGEKTGGGARDVRG